VRISARQLGACHTSNGLAELQYAATAYEWVICQQADGQDPALHVLQVLRAADGIWAAL